MFWDTYFRRSRDIYIYIYICSWAADVSHHIRHLRGLGANTGDGIYSVLIRKSCFFSCLGSGFADNAS